MRAHRSIWLTLAVVAFVLGGSWLLGRGPRLSGAPLANVPAGASGMLRIEPAALRASALWQQGVVAQGGDRGLRELQARCGFDPLSSVEDLILFATGGQAHQLQHVGVIARGRFDLARLGACMRSALEDSGGELERTELLGVPAMQGGGGNSRAAFIGDQAVIWGHERVVSRVIRTTRGELESADSDALLHALYAELAPGQPIVAVGRIPEAWRPALERHLGGASNGAAPSRTLLGLGVAANLERGLSLRLLARTRSPEAAHALLTRLDALRQEALERALGMSPLNPALRALELRAHGADVEVRLTLEEPRLRELISSFFESFQPAHRPAAPERSQRPSPPDERLDRSDRER